MLQRAWEGVAGLLQRAGAGGFWAAMYLLQFASWYYSRESELRGVDGHAAAGAGTGTVPRAPPRRDLALANCTPFYQLQSG